jgi:transcriptional regulator NrdR family protein
MKCECGNPTRVIETRSLKGTKYRRRLCSCGSSFYTKEITCEKFPYKKVVKKKKKVVYKVKKKPKKKPEPKLNFKGIPVTKKSPEWLKRVATLINE